MLTGILLRKQNKKKTLRLFLICFSVLLIGGLILFFVL